MSSRLAVDWLLCSGHGVCAAVAPRLVQLDDWGFPVVPRGDLPRELVGEARAAAAVCPARALSLSTTRSSA